MADSRHHQEKRPGVIDREERLARSRNRAAAKREQLQAIMQKGQRHRTPEEQALLDRVMEQRHKKNERARKRAGEQCQALNIIMEKPEEQRTAMEKSFVEQQLKRKIRKVEGDKLRRLRNKHGDEPRFHQNPLPNVSNLQRINYSVVTEQILRNQQSEGTQASDLETDRKSPANTDRLTNQAEAASLQDHLFKGHTPSRPKSKPIGPSYGVAFSRPHTKNVATFEAPPQSYHRSNCSSAFVVPPSGRNEYDDRTRRNPSLFRASLPPPPRISSGASPNIGTTPGAQHRGAYDNPQALSSVAPLRQVPPPPIFGTQLVQPPAPPVPPPHPHYSGYHPQTLSNDVSLGRPPLPPIFSTQPVPPLLPPVISHSHYSGYGRIAAPLPPHYRRGEFQHDSPSSGYYVMYHSFFDRQNPLLFRPSPSPPSTSGGAKPNIGTVPSAHYRGRTYDHPQALSNASPLLGEEPPPPIVGIQPAPHPHHGGYHPQALSSVASLRQPPNPRISSQQPATTAPHSYRHDHQHGGLPCC